MSNSEQLGVKPLQVVIVGAGIGGLSAAIGLRQQGHHVTLLEQSRFNRETGAAIHIAPNCYGILQRFGLRAEDVQAVELLGFDDYRADGEKVAGVDLWKTAGRWQHPWMLVHRVNLHNALKHLTSTLGAILKTSSRVIDISYEEGTVICQSGEKYEADLIIGADGVHSVARNFITDKKILPHGSGKSGYRFLIPSDNLRNDPEASFFMDDGRLKVVSGPDRKLIGYPCNGNSLMNCMFAFPTSEVGVLSAEYNQQGNKDRLLQVASGFGTGSQAVLSHVDPDDLNIWELLDMETLPSWRRGCLILLGDAAHPFLPWLGQGGAMAIEDAASIAALLPLGTKREELEERLKLYEQCRHPRATKVQELTRIAGANAEEQHPNHMKFAQESTAYTFGHDEWDHSTQALREHVWKQSQSQPTIWSMPVGFGPQVTRGKGESSCQMRRASIRFKTSRTRAQNLLPNSSFAFTAPDTVIQATWQYTKTDGDDECNRCALYFHGVRYKSQNGKEVHGSFSVVEFDASVESVVTGREQFGLPRIHCSLKEELDDGFYRLLLGASGGTFGELEWDFTNKTGRSSQQSGRIGDILTHKYISSVEGDKADFVCPILIRGPLSNENNTDCGGFQVEKTSSADNGRISFNMTEAMIVERLQKVVGRLSDLPVYEIVGAVIEDGVRSFDDQRAVRVED